MQERYIAPTIMLTAGAITSIFNIINGVDLFEGLKKILIVLLIFYIIGRIATIVIVKATKNNYIKENVSYKSAKNQENEDNSTEEN